MIRFSIRLLAFGALALSLASAADYPEEPKGAVYTTTNLASGNSILVFRRNADGKLKLWDTVDTKGLGTGAGLSSQGALVASADGRWMVAVNAGSNDVSLFAVTEDGLKFRSRAPSGGIMPVSAAIWNDLIYVVNAGSSPKISGLWIGENGMLKPVANSTRLLQGADPAQISFDRDGDILTVTEKGTHTIETFFLDGYVPSEHVLNPSSAQTPFGFAFGRHDQIVVTDATGGPGGSAAAPSYKLMESGELRVITTALPLTQNAACWVIIMQNGKYAFTANTGSSTLSSLGIDRNGGLSLVRAVAASPGEGSKPIDLAFSYGDEFLYSLNFGTGTITGFAVGQNGTLEWKATVPNVPKSAAGIVAR